MQIPVYIFAGFLDSGKTSLIMDTFKDESFMQKISNTLLISFEQGEKEYDQAFLKQHSIHLVQLNKHDELTSSLSQKLQNDYQAQQIFIECNGMQSLEPLINNLPKMWLIVQLITTINATTFELYMNTMRSIMYEQIRFADTVIFNRCHENTRASFLRSNIKAINQRSGIYYEGAFGQAIRLKESLLPYDKKASFLDISDQDYGLWYMDAMEHPDDYNHKTIILRGKFAQKLPGYKQSFILGRQAMVCCARDTNLCGITVTGVRIDEMQLNDWLEVEGKLSLLDLDNGSKTLLLTASRVQFYQAPLDEYVYFS